MLDTTLYSTQPTKALGTAENAAYAFFIDHIKGSTQICQDVEEKNVISLKSSITEEKTI
jgi:hypothetical protein